MEEEFETQVTKSSPEDVNPYRALALQVEIRPLFSYVEYHYDSLTRASKSLPYTPLSFFQHLEIKNDSGSTLPGLALEFRFDCPALKLETIALPPLPSPAMPLRLPFLNVDRGYFETIQTSLPSSLTVTLLRTSDGLVLETLTLPFTILPLGQFTEAVEEDARLYAKFVTPDDPKVKQLSLRAVLYNEGKPFLAYQNSDVNDMLKELSALYQACHEANIVYQNPPSNDSIYQRLRLPFEVLRDKKATCLDATILFASLALEVGYHPILVLEKRHSYVGIFLKEKSHFQGGKSEKIGDLHGLLKEHNPDAVFIETTMFLSSSNASFANALESGKNHLTLYEDSYLEGVDVCFCHKSLVYNALPSSPCDEELENCLSSKRLEEKDLSPILPRVSQTFDPNFSFDRFEAWKIKLLDLSEKNKLVRFKMEPSTCLRLLAKDFIASLQQADSLKLILPSLANADIVASFLNKSLESFSAYLDPLNADEALAFGQERVLTSLLKKARAAEEETGASPLYLSLGMLSYTSPKSKTRAHAPFLLLPVAIKKEAGNKGYTMSYDLGDIRINETFFEYYKSAIDRESSYSSLYGFSDLASYDSLVATFKDMGGDVTLDESFYFLSNVSFAHQVMWLDMEKRREELEKNIIVKSILSNQSLLEEEIIDDASSVESLENYEDFAAPLYYDSSQLKAILDCGEGKSFILDGPPGTGKSQTIVNMICNAFYHGRKVLFVAEKKAALDVVASRLQRLGLGNYCLELHSSKATKGDFFQKLGTVMEFGPTKSVEEYETLCQELTRSKNELKATLDKMHEGQDYFLSLYDCILAVRQLEYLKDKALPLSEEFLSSYDANKDGQVHHLIDTYTSLASSIDNYDASPLRALGLKKLNFILDKEKLLYDFKSAKRALDEALSIGKHYMEGLPLRLSFTLDNLALVLNLSAMAYDERTLPRMDYFFKDTSMVEDTFRAMKDFLKLRNSYESKIDIEGLLKVTSIETLSNLLREGKGFFASRKALKEVRTKLDPYLREEVPVAATGNFILYLSEYEKARAKLTQNTEKFEEIFGKTPLDCLLELDNLKARYAYSQSFAAKLRSSAPSFDAPAFLGYFVALAQSKDPLAKVSFDIALKAYEGYSALLNHLREDYLLRDYLLPKDDYVNALSRLLDYCAEEEHYETIASFVGINKLEDGFAEVGLSALLHASLSGTISYDEMGDLWHLSLAYACLKAYFAHDEVNSWSAASFNEQIRAYQQKIEQYSALTVQAISARVSAKFARNDFNYATSGAIGTLKRFCANNGRGLSIRRALSDYGEAILEYLPCFLMSPLSAAQYLSVDKGAFSSFDIVIFDEASQIPTHEAIGPIARGKALIVSGDPKQMPPSPYFSSGLLLSEEDDDDLEAFTDSPSLLDECLAISLPRHRLSYHYRSKHEALIEFSNATFYNGGLRTFPSVLSSSRPVEFVYVEPKIAKKDSSMSKEELAAVVSAFKSVYDSPRTAKRSVGIIVFNILQAEKVSDALSELLSNDQELNAKVEEATKRTGEPYFVKSLENVQGDERDIIILSIGFSRSKEGYPVIRGPLVAGDNNGSRRLNVAASRSKHKMIIVSTIKASQFPADENIKNPGAKCLKDFLRYVEFASNKTVPTTREKDNTLLYYLKQDLIAHGYEVDSHVGKGDFGVDLALKRPGDDHYELGILFDESSLPPSVSTRDIFYLKTSVLMAQRWKILRVYALEYFKSPNATLKAIDEAFASAFTEASAIEAVKIEQEDVAKLGNPYGAEEFKLPELVPLGYDNEYGYDPNIEEIIRDLLEISSPISYKSIRAFIGRSCDFKQFNVERERRLKDILNRRFYQNRKMELGQYFYFKDTAMKVDSFRLASMREIEDIALEEIATAMRAILREEPGINQEDLFHQLMVAFAFPTKALTRPYLERFKEAAKLL